MNSVKTFILRVNNLSNSIEDLCLHGGCWQFHLLLKEVWPDAVPYWNDVHVITKIGSSYYDVTGIVSNKGYKIMPYKAQCFAASWKSEYFITVIGQE